MTWAAHTAAYRQMHQAYVQSFTLTLRWQVKAEIRRRTDRLAPGKQVRVALPRPPRPPAAAAPLLIVPWRVTKATRKLCPLPVRVQQVRNSPITLQIFAYDLPTLSLVDLPGLVQGRRDDQSAVGSGAGLGSGVSNPCLACSPVCPRSP